MPELASRDHDVSSYDRHITASLPRRALTADAAHAIEMMLAAMQASLGPVLGRQSLR